MADREVIREFLASLGYQVDQPSARKFIDSLESTSKLAAGLGKTIAGVAVAAEAMVDTFAFSMEKLYYASRRTKSSVESLQAVSFGFRQIGLSGEGAISTLEAMAAATRMNPGLRALLDSLLGKKTEGMDQMKVMLNLVQRLSSLPHFVGAQFASMFGMDEQTFMMMKDQMPQLLAAEEKRRQMNRDSGIDAQRAAAASREYANSLGELWERVKVLGMAFAIELLPYFRDFTKWLNGFLRDLAKSTELKEFTGQIKSMLDALKEFANSETGGQVWQGLKNAALAMVEAIRGLLALFSGDLATANELIVGAGRRLLFGNEKAGAEPRGGGILMPGEMMLPPTRPLGVPFGVGASTVKIEQKTDIHVSGGGDPASTAREVFAGQGRVNAELRDLVGSTR